MSTPSRTRDRLLINTSPSALHAAKRHGVWVSESYQKKLLLLLAWLPKSSTATVKQPTCTYKLPAQAAPVLSITGAWCNPSYDQAAAVPTLTLL